MADLECKKIVIPEGENENWDGNSADEEVKVRKESVVSNKEKEKEEEKPKIQKVKENLKKDKKGNIIIESLGEYIEPTRKVKETRQEDMKGQTDKFAGIDVSDDEDDNKNQNVGFSGLEVEKEVVSKNKKKGGKGKKNKKGGDDEDLDDVFKDLGVEIKQQ